MQCSELVLMNKVEFVQDKLVISLLKIDQVNHGKLHVKVIMSVELNWLDQNFQVGLFRLLFLIYELIKALI